MWRDFFGGASRGIDADDVENPAESSNLRRQTLRQRNQLAWMPIRTPRQAPIIEHPQDHAAQRAAQGSHTVAGPEQR